MSFPISAAGFAVLSLLFAGGWAVIRYWQGKGLDATELQRRRGRVRIWAGVTCLTVLTLTIVGWRLWVAGVFGPGPGFFLIPLGAIVSFLGVISVRGLLFLASSPTSRLQWLNSSRHWVSLPVAFVGIVSFVTVADVRGVVDPTTFLVLLSFAALTTLVALGYFSFGWRLFERDGQSTLEPQDRADAIQRAISVRAPRGESVFMLFDFPEQVRVPCEQYLLYFGQFLRDLGVEVNTALTPEAGQVLFSVTPTDKKEALNKIRVALDLYLHLPSSPMNDTTNESIEVQRLEAAIFRFKSDLKLAAAELQAKNRTIEAQQLIISVQKGLMNGEVLVDSLKEVTPKPEDQEYVIDGVVALGTFEAKVVKLNLGELFRKLKRFFGRKGK